MDKRDEGTVSLLASKVLQVIRSLLNQPAVEVRHADLDLLAQFSAMSAESAPYRLAGEKARSLLSLLADRSERPLDDLIYVQLLAIAQSMEESINLHESGWGGNPLLPLVTPIQPSESRESNELVIVVDNPTLIERLHQVGAEARFTVTRLGGFEEIESFNESNCPAAIIADISLFQLNPQATAALNGLRHRLMQPPHLFVLGNPEDIPARIDAVRLGATRFISLPLDVRRLVSVLKGVTLKKAPEPYRVMLIDDDRTFSSTHEYALNKAGMQTLSLSNPLAAPIQIGCFQPDVILSDIFMKGCNGLELLAVIRQDDSLADTPVIFLSSETDPRRRIEALELGGDDFLCKPVSIPLFISTVLAHAKRSRRLKRTRRDLHELFGQMRQAGFGTHGGLAETRIIELQGELLPPNLIPPEDYQVTEAPNTEAASQ